MYTININGDNITCFYDNGKGEVYQSVVSVKDYDSQAKAIEDAQAKALALVTA